ncbi:MAG: hypothetical protein GTN78_16170, partial [Gemmatimonadales bacterium]|nr:hypothetical protein [Gemmatimonadales bacterium]
MTEVDLQGIANQVILRDSDLLGTLWIGGGYSGQGDEQLSYSPHLVLEESS